MIQRYYKYDVGYDILLIDSQLATVDYKLDWHGGPGKQVPKAVHALILKPFKSQYAPDIVSQ